MKKILLSVFVLSILLPTLAFASFDTSLKYGSKGSAVNDLQDFLSSQGFLKGKADGSFGLVTLKAVEAWQTSVGLSSDGYFGTGSRTKANATLATLLQASNTAEQSDTGTVANISTVAGCTSTSLYSATTGQPCTSTIQPTIPNLPAGCTSTSGFSTTTGQACNGLVATVQQLQQTVQQQAQTIQQIQQNTQQIVQNTTPTPPIITPLPTPPVIPTTAPVVSVIQNPNFITTTIPLNTSGAIIGSFIIKSDKNLEETKITAISVGLDGSLVQSTNFKNNIGVMGIGAAFGTAPISNPTIGTSLIGSPTTNNVFSVNTILLDNSTIIINVYMNVNSTSGTIIPTLTVNVTGSLSKLRGTSSAVGQTITVQ